MDEGTVQAAVARAFLETGAGTTAWPDPHPDGEPADDEYSRCLDPAKYRLVGARVDAWLRALTELGLATVSDVGDPNGAWRDGPPLRGGAVTRAHRVQPARAGAVPLLVCLRDLDGVPDAYVTVGAGQPAIEIATVPHCECDACDDGSDRLVEQLDELVLDVVSGALVHVTLAEGVVLARRNGLSARGPADAERIEELLAEARAGRSRHPVVMGARWW